MMKQPSRKHVGRLKIGMWVASPTEATNMVISAREGRERVAFEAF